MYFHLLSVVVGGVEPENMVSEPKIIFSILVTAQAEAKFFFPLSPFLDWQNFDFELGLKSQSKTKAQNP